MYLDFWPCVSRVWKLKFDIEPILLYVDEKNIDIDDTYGTVIKLTPILNISTVSQSQFARLWYLQFFPKDVCITTDMDMIPLSSYPFKTAIENIDDDEYILSGVDETTISICYNIAKGSIFKKYLELKNTWEEQIYILKDSIYQINGEIYWGSDEIYLANKLKNKSIMRLIRPSESRIDRSHYNYNYWPYSVEKLKLGMYYDCHSIRPYNTYKNEIDKLINYIL
jgi:hypothetical protein